MITDIIIISIINCTVIADLIYRINHQRKYFNVK